MKKGLILGFSILLFMITGCSRNSSLLNNVVSVNYKNVVLLENDMLDIVEKINKIDFDAKSAIDVLEEDISPLVIESDNIKYEFIFVDGNICYKTSGSTTGSYSCGKAKGIESDLDELYDTYTSENFKITFDNDYTVNDGTIVKYEDTNESIIIELNEEVKSVYIYKSELDEDGNVISGDVIYNVENTDKKLIVKTTPSETVPKMLIRITNKYGVSFVYMPTYNGRTGEIGFYSPTSS
jgi:hypothetical protein